MAKVNYTPEMIATATQMYQDSESGNDVISEIAEALGRSVNSVRAKLVREKVYVADEKAPAKPRDLGPTKGELLTQLADMVPFDVAGLTGANKAAIQSIIDFAESVQTEADEA